MRNGAHRDSARHRTPCATVPPQATADDRRRAHESMPPHAPISDVSATCARRTGRRPRATALAGERVELFAERALHWPRAATRVRRGRPSGQGGGVSRGRRAAAARRHRDRSGASGRRWSRARRRAAWSSSAISCMRRPGRVAALDAAFRAWRAHARRRSRSCWCAATTTTVPAIRLRTGASRWSPSRIALAPFLACHVPVSPPTGYALCGHIHPGVRLSGSGGQSERLPCFVLGRRRAILPAFGGFTGLALVSAGTRRSPSWPSPASGCSRCPRPAAERAHRPQGWRTYVPGASPSGA